MLRWTGWLLMISLVVFISILFIILLIPLVLVCLSCCEKWLYPNRIIEREERLIAELIVTKQVINPKTKSQKCYSEDSNHQTAENSPLNRHLQEHNERNGEEKVPECQSERSDSSNSHNSFSTNSDGRHQCAICLEPFREGEEVSWAKHPHICDHVFHTKCIRMWLKGGHIHCPCCRSEYYYVPKDIQTLTSSPSCCCCCCPCLCKKPEPKADDELERERADFMKTIENRSNGKFCEVNGLKISTEINPGPVAPIRRTSISRRSTGSVGSVGRTRIAPATGGDIDPLDFEARVHYTSEVTKCSSSSRSSHSNSIHSNRSHNISIDDDESVDRESEQSSIYVGSENDETKNDHVDLEAMLPGCEENNSHITSESITNTDTILQDNGNHNDQCDLENMALGSDKTGSANNYNIILNSNSEDSIQNDSTSTTFNGERNTGQINVHKETDPQDLEAMPLRNDMGL